jgi:4-hydroxythreonine-4-phosphate dehydrogenase
VQGLEDHAHIPDMLNKACLRCALINLDCIRSDRNNLSDRLKSASAHADVLVCDAETDDDLTAVATASMQLESMPMWVGSAGLAYQLPKAVGIAKAETTQQLSPSTISGPVLFTIGSLSRNSVEQVRQLAATENAAVITVAPAVLLAGEQHPDWLLSLHQLRDAIAARRDVVLTPGTGERIDFERRPQLAAALANMAASIRDEIGALVASGGETARAVFEAFGITRLRLRGELEKGIPISIAENWSRRSLPVITKAGDFGGIDALIKCSTHLHAKDSSLASPCETGKVVE